jgi:hypothetical protein
MQGVTKSMQGSKGREIKLHCYNIPDYLCVVAISKEVGSCFLKTEAKGAHWVIGLVLLCHIVCY